MAKHKTKELPGMTGAGVEDKRIKAIDDAYEDWDDAKEKRMTLTEREIETRDKLVQVMQSHGVSKYRYDGKLIECDSKTRIKVSKVKDGEEG